MAEIFVADYGVGNLLSVERALVRCGANEVYVGSDVARLEKASALVIPGVGAFGDGMRGLREAGLIEPIRQFAASGRPVLGICLGMQMMATIGWEHGRHEGLALIPGEVTPIPAERGDGERRRIPSIGWRVLQCQASTASGARWLKPGNGRSVYLVHSFQFQVEEKTDLIATYDYEGVAVAAAVARNNILGVQFHPEKSGVVGLEMLRAFTEVAA